MKPTIKQLQYKVLIQGRTITEDTPIDIFLDSETPIWGNNNIPMDSIVCVVNDTDETLEISCKRVY